MKIKLTPYPLIQAASHVIIPINYKAEVGSNLRVHTQFILRRIKLIVVAKSVGDDQLNQKRPFCKECDQQKSEVMVIWSCICTKLYSQMQGYYLSPIIAQMRKEQLHTGTEHGGYNSMFMPSWLDMYDFIIDVTNVLEQPPWSFQ